jgi:hypothetical protein
MKKFIVLYRAPVSAGEQMASSTPEQAQAGMDLWMAWAKKAGPALVDLGSPLGDPVSVGAGGPLGVHLGGYSVLQANDGAAVRKVLEGHPHLMLPGASIDVLEFLAIPGM